MPTKLTKREAVPEELTSDNLQSAVRRLSHPKKPSKRLQYFPDENPIKTPRKKWKNESHDETYQMYSKNKTASLKVLKEVNKDMGQTNEELSAYELERLENIRKNQEFLSALNIFQASEELKQSVRRKAPQRGLRRSQTVQSEVLPPRRSMRLQNVEAEFLPLPLDILQTIHDQPLKKSGPLLMEPVNMSEGSKLPQQLMEIWAENTPKEKNKQLDRQQYRCGLSHMKITEDRVAKVVKDCVCSAAFHPCSSSILMAAGAKLGQVGLWSLSSTWGDDGVLLFEPHFRAVTCMAFSPAYPTDFLSASYDGTMRRMDVEKAVFDEVYEIEDGLKTFDFLSHDGMSLVVGSWYGDIAIVDRRTPGNSHESLHKLYTRAVRCVSVHPLQKQYFAVTENLVVNIYDSRFLKKSKSVPVCQLKGYSKSVTNAYFSPVTGNRILTCCLDGRIRIYDTSATTKVPLLKTIRDDMFPDFWESKLSAVWDPKQEDCFAVGSLSKDRRVQVYHESGQLLHSFTDDENLTTVQSVVAFHPTRNVLMGGDLSGHLHVFAD